MKKQISKANSEKLDNLIRKLSDNQVNLKELTKAVKTGEIQEGKIHEFIRRNKNEIILVLEIVKMWTPSLVDTIVDMIINYIKNNYA